MISIAGLSLWHKSEGPRAGPDAGAAAGERRALSSRAKPTSRSRSSVSIRELATRSTQYPSRSRRDASSAIRMVFPVPAAPMSASTPGPVPAASSSPCKAEA